MLLQEPLNHYQGYSIIIHLKSAIAKVLLLDGGGYTDDQAADNGGQKENKGSAY